MSSGRDQKHYLFTRDKIRISDLKQSKILNQKWGMLTCYDATSAKIFDLARIPVLLVGDSASQAVFGHKSTIPITMDEMIPIAKAVASSCQRALVIGDMPFGSYQESPQVALKNAIRFMKEAGVHAVKLEGGVAYEEHVRLLTTSGIPVMAHVGLTPQSENILSGYKVQGRSESDKLNILNDAKRLEAAGAFACVVEAVPSDVGKLLTSNTEIPIVGIGAGPHTDAQVLVWTDMAGFSPPHGTYRKHVSTPFDSPQTTRDKAAKEMKSDQDEQNYDGLYSDKNVDICLECEGWNKWECDWCITKIELSKAPKFVKRYANMSDILYLAAKEFYNDVARGRYPGEQHCYK